MSLRQSRTINALRALSVLACIFSAILHKFRLTGVVSPGGGCVTEGDRGVDRQTSLPALTLHNLTKNLRRNHSTIIMRFCLTKVLESTERTFL